jgi:ABC-type sugar transport system ATPase subunit
VGRKTYTLASSAHSILITVIAHTTLTAPVKVVEHLDSELPVYMKVAGKNIVARFDPRSRTHPSSTAKMHVDIDNIHLFDTETGKAILTCCNKGKEGRV